MNKIHDALKIIREMQRHTYVVTHELVDIAVISYAVSFVNTIIHTYFSLYFYGVTPCRMGIQNSLYIVACIDL